MDLLQALSLIKEPNYTTQYQSRELLAIGLPVDSADMIYYPYFDSLKGRTSLQKYPEFLRIMSYSETVSHSSKDENQFLPCWSVGQLIKIYLICNPYESDEDLKFMLTSGVEVPDLCNFIISWLRSLKPDFNNVNKIIG